MIFLNNILQWLYGDTESLIDLEYVTKSEEKNESRIIDKVCDDSAEQCTNDDK